MSLETWKEEFYPISADELVGQGVDELERLRHALRKWEGLRKEALERHEVAKRGSYVCTAFEGNLRVAGDTCTLCVAHPDDCAGCSLFVHRSHVACDEETDEEKNNRHISPYHTWVYDGDPEPMIRLLQAVLAQAEWRLKTLNERGQPTT